MGGAAEVGGEEVADEELKLERWGLASRKKDLEAEAARPEVEGKAEEGFLGLMRGRDLAGVVAGRKGAVEGKNQSR